MAGDLARSRIAVLGCGAVGGSVAHALLAAPAFRGTLALWSRSPGSVRRVLAGLSPWARRRAERAANVHAAVDGAGLVLLCVSEAGLAPVLEELARAGRTPPRTVLVTSGSWPLPRGGVARASRLGRWHPLAPFPRRRVTPLAGMPFGIEGPPAARRAARWLAELFEGPVLVLRAGRADVYHAGAALLGGGLVALLELAEATFARGTRARRADVHAALDTFARAVLREVRAHGPARALTGPIARGSEGTVRRHLAALEAVPRARSAYAELGRTMLALARTRGALSPQAARGLETLLESSRRATRGGRVH